MFNSRWFTAGVLAILAVLLGITVYSALAAGVAGSGRPAMTEKMILGTDDSGDGAIAQDRHDQNVMRLLHDDRITAFDRHYKNALRSPDDNSMVLDRHDRNVLRWLKATQRPDQDK